jgi:hypothetical protein
MTHTNSKNWPYAMQLSLRLAQYGIVRAWTEVPVTVAATASMSLVLAWCLALMHF